jgi:hypothetical protein
MKKVTLLQVDDWMGLYIDGVLMDENHNLSERGVLEILARELNFPFEHIWDEDDGYIEKNGGRCPENLPTPTI